MKHVYRVKLEQWTNGEWGPVKYNEETLDVIATNATLGLSKALTAARKNGFLKSRPIEVRSLERIASIDIA